MIYTGVVFEKQAVEIAAITVTETEQYLWVNVIVNTTVVIKFPLAKDSDSNAIISRTRNVINQTGLVSNPVTVTIEAIP